MIKDKLKEASHDLAILCGIVGFGLIITAVLTISLTRGFDLFMSILDFVFNHPLACFVSGILLLLLGFGLARYAE